MQTGKSEGKAADSCLSKPVLAGVLVVLVILVLFILPEISVANVSVTGTEILKEADVIRMVEPLVAQKSNILFFNTNAAAEALLKESYIKSVEVKKRFPNAIDIIIVERKPKCYVEYMNMDTYLIIDEFGMVLSITSYAGNGMPVVTGLRFTSFAVGSILETENPFSFANAVLLSKMFEKYGLENVTGINISDEQDIHLFVRGVDVELGSIDDADEKIGLAKAALDKLPEDKKGFLNVKNPANDPVFRHLR